VASRVGGKLNPRALVFAEHLVDFAEDARDEPPKAEPGAFTAAELYLALKALGRDPLEVARRARERWERWRTERLEGVLGGAPVTAGGAPAESAPAAAGREERRWAVGRARLGRERLGELADWLSAETVPAPQGTAPATPAGSRVVVLKVKSLGKRLSEKGRVKVIFMDDTEYSLDVSRIQGIYYLDYVYYIVYETDNPEFYVKHTAPEVPQLAVSLGFEIERYVEQRCKGCGKPIEWDADEPYCPRCGWDDFPGYYEVEVKELKVKTSLRDELEEFAEKLLGTGAELVETLYRTPAGGYWPKVELSDMRVKLYSTEVEAVAIAENPVFKESHWDEIETYEHKYEGKYLILMLRSGLEQWGFALLRLSGEPKLDLLEKLVKEEEERKKQAEEEARKREEERKKREEEEEKKWSDPKAVVETVVASLPDWADGAYVKQKAVWGEDADVITYVMPVKRSQRGSGYYTSDSWRHIYADVPDKFLEPLVGKVITKNGETVRVREKRNGGKYVNLEVVVDG
jgi:hypothetical protein